MKVLLDEDLPHKLRTAILGHEVITVAYLGWKGLKNGALLKAAEEAGFEVFLTGDQKLPSQQNLNGRPFGTVVLTSLDIEIIRLHIGEIMAAVDNAIPASLRVVECREHRR